MHSIPTIHSRDSILNILSTASTVSIVNIPSMCSILSTRSILPMRSTHSIHNTRGTLARLIIIQPHPIKQQRMEISRALPRLIPIDIGLAMALFDRHTIRLPRAQVPAQECQLMRSRNSLGLVIRHLKATMALRADLQPSPRITYPLFGHNQITDPHLEKSVGPTANDQDELILVAY
ncbi:hypothetical protein THARTR1_07139 [Trichoderma harzianum]|uniref:Uncharacterized protein n=1 Tax=Trichoderma harzianum TaxID=5544 RepID=A0A2K0U2C8_TRIHA|nr:hypothetical protein THARTR1_07139 [Trichoderma harzianum]